MVQQDESAVVPVDAATLASCDDLGLDNDLLTAAHAQYLKIARGMEFFLFEDLRLLPAFAGWPFCTLVGRIVERDAAHRDNRDHDERQAPFPVFAKMYAIVTGHVSFGEIKSLVFRSLDHDRNGRLDHNDLQASFRNMLAVPGRDVSRNLVGDAMLNAHLPGIIVGLHHPGSSNPRGEVDAGVSQEAFWELNEHLLEELFQNLCLAPEKD